MGTVLGVLFIVVAAAAGLFVGTRPTVMDGRWIAAKLSKTVGDKGLTFECDREIPVGVKGAEFACVVRGAAGTSKVRYRMTRDGKVEARTGARRLGRGARTGAAAGEAVEPGAGAEAVEPGAGAEAVEPGAGATEAVDPGGGAEAVDPGGAGEAGED